MATYLKIAENTGLTTNVYNFPINPMQPKGLKDTPPVNIVRPLNGTPGIQVAKNWYPEFQLVWPAILKSQYSDMITAVISRRYELTGLDYYLGALTDPGNGWPFPTIWSAAKYINIRIIDVDYQGNPVDNSIDEFIGDLIARVIWLDAS